MGGGGGGQGGWRRVKMRRMEKWTRLRWRGDPHHCFVLAKRCVKDEGDPIGASHAPGVEPIKRSPSLAGGEGRARFLSGGGGARERERDGEPAVWDGGERRRPAPGAPLPSFLPHPRLELQVCAEAAPVNVAASLTRTGRGAASQPALRPAGQIGRTMGRENALRFALSKPPFLVSIPRLGWTKWQASRPRPPRELATRGAPDPNAHPSSLP